MAGNLLIINGSPRKEGFTNTICSESLKNSGFKNVAVFDCYENQIKPCIACGKCAEIGECVFDDLKEFFDLFEKTDVIVFLSPIYNGGLSSPLKALVDRFQVYFNLFYKNEKIQPIKKRRKAILLCTAGRDGEDEFSYVKKQLERSFTILNISLTGAVLCKNTDTEPDYENSLNEFQTLLRRSSEDE